MMTTKQEKLQIILPQVNAKKTEEGAIPSQEYTNIYIYIYKYIYIYIYIYIYMLNTNTRTHQYLCYNNKKRKRLQKQNNCSLINEKPKCLYK